MSRHGMREVAVADDGPAGTAPIRHEHPGIRAVDAAARRAVPR